MTYYPLNHPKFPNEADEGLIAWLEETKRMQHESIPESIFFFENDTYFRLVRTKVTTSVIDYPDPGKPTTIYTQRILVYHCDFCTESDLTAYARHLKLKRLQQIKTQNQNT